jgi:hypothetical protein
LVWDSSSGSYLQQSLITAKFTVFSDWESFLYENLSY